MTAVISSMIHMLTHVDNVGLSDLITKRIDHNDLPRLLSTFLVVELDETRDNLFKIWVIGAGVIKGTKEEMIVIASATTTMDASWVTKINDLFGTFRCDSIWVTHSGVYAALKLCNIHPVHMIGEGAHL